MNSKHDVVAELKRVTAELGHTPSRQEYRQYGNIPDSVIERLFGRYSVALSAAGLVRIIQRPATFHEKIEEQYDTRCGLLEQFNTQIMPWVGK